MSDLQVHPHEHTSGRDVMHPGSSIIPSREVPLGGPRGMTVRRTLPSRGRTMIGAWCFVDHYGPDDVTMTGGMVVAPHPLNLMTAGHGVSHSEVSTPDTTLLHGVQLWTVLPAEHRDVAPSFQHHEPEPLQVGGASLIVFLGSVGVEGGATATSPVTTYSPLLGAEVRLEPDAEVTLTLDAAFEHGVLLDRGELRVNGCPLERSHLLHEAPGPTAMTLTAGVEGADLIVLGGTPFGERIVMWWNFIGRTHEDIVAAREEWQAELARAPHGRFGAFDHPGDSLPAPELPPVRLRPRA
jgi:hypothetical protein